MHFICSWTPEPLTQLYIGLQFWSIKSVPNAFEAISCSLDTSLYWNIARKALSIGELTRFKVFFFSKYNKFYLVVSKWSVNFLSCCACVPIQTPSPSLSSPVLQVQVPVPVPALHHLRTVDNKVLIKGEDLAVVQKPCNENNCHARSAFFAALILKK